MFFEVKGGGVQYDYGFRIYDSRIARFMSVDPLTASYPWYTPYQFAGNMPIIAVDLDGLEPHVVNGKLIGYHVMEGQGPTQIAADINNPWNQLKYGYYLTARNVPWQKIVYYNKEAFKNVYEGSGNPYNKYSSDYLAGNIKTGDYLKVPSFIAVQPTRKPTNHDQPINNNPTPDGVSDSDFSDSKLYKFLPTVVSVDAGLNINIPTNVGVGPGVRLGISYNWITKGKNKSIFPKNFTFNYGVGAGVGVAGGGSITPMWYLGDPDNLSGDIFNSNEWSDASVNISILSGAKINGSYLLGVSIPFLGVGDKTNGVYINWSEELVKFQNDNKNDNKKQITP